MTNFGFEILASMKTLNKDILKKPIYCGVNCETYRVFNDKLKDKIRRRIISSSGYLSSHDDPVFIGYVGRNQRRKLLPCFYLLDSMIRSGNIMMCSNGNHPNPIPAQYNYEWQYNKRPKWKPGRCPCGCEPVPAEFPNFVFWLHTPPGDRGWNLPEMEDAFGLTDKVTHTVGHKILQGISESEFASVYNTFDIYLSFATEGFGLPLLEAMACGVPVISPRVAASQEFMQRLGLFWEPSDIYMADGS